MEEKQIPNILLVHIEHSKPIEINEFTQSLNAIGNLFSSFAQEQGESKEMSQANLYVEKIESGCIDIFLCETVSAGIIPFVENMNIILEFSSYLKTIIEYFTLGKGKEPKLKLNEAKNFKDLFTITANDNKGEMSIGAIAVGNKGCVYQNCTFNFPGSNSAQNQLDKEIERIKSIQPIGDMYKRRLMTIYQMRGDMNVDAGNKAVIESISPRKVSVVFSSDDLKEAILHSDDNPTKKAYWVDVETLNVNGRLVGYNVLALHDTIPID